MYAATADAPRLLAGGVPLGEVQQRALAVLVALVTKSVTTALLVLLAALLTGAEAFGFDVAMLAAIGSIGAIILSRRGG